MAVTFVVQEYMPVTVVLLLWERKAVIVLFWERLALTVGVVLQERIALADAVGKALDCVL